MRYAWTCLVGLVVVGCGAEVRAPGEGPLADPYLPGPAVMEDPIDEGPGRPRDEPGAPPAATEPPALPGGALKTRCTTVVDQAGAARIATIDLDSGRTTLGAPVTLPDPIDLSSLGARGQKLFACGGAGVVRIDARTGAVDETKARCDAVSADEDGLWILDRARETVSRYVDWAALRAGAPAEIAPAPKDASRVAVRARTLIAAPYRGNVVTVMEGGAAPRAVGLEAFAGAIAGVDVAADGRRLLLTSPDLPAGNVMVFDLVTGAYLSTARAATGSALAVTGLACEAATAP